MHLTLIVTAVFLLLSNCAFSQADLKRPGNLDSLKRVLVSSLNEQIKVLQDGTESMKIGYKNDREKLETEKDQVLNFWFLQTKYRELLDSLELGIREFSKSSALISTSNESLRFQATITKSPDGLEDNPYYASIYGNILDWLYPGYFSAKTGIQQDDSLSDLEKRYPNVFKMRANDLNHLFPSVGIIKKRPNLTDQFPKNEGKLPSLLHASEVMPTKSASGEDPIEDLYFRLDSLQQLHDGLKEHTGMNAHNEHLTEIGDLVNFWMIQDQYRYLLDALELGKKDPLNTLSRTIDPKDFFWSEAKENSLNTWGSIIVDTTLKNRFFYSSDYDIGLKLVRGDSLLHARYPKVFKMLGKEITILQTEKNPVFKVRYYTASSIGRLQIPSFSRKNNSLEAKKRLADDLYQFIVYDSRPIQIENATIRNEVEEFQRRDKGYPANFSEKKIDEFILFRRVFIEHLKKIYEKE